MSEKVKGIIVLVIVVILVAIIAITSSENKKEDTVNKIVAVHVKGEVENPGYYELSYGSRVKDAVDKAGGATENANLGAVNLAAKLRDGEEIILPAKSTPASVDSAVSDASSVETEESFININTADISKLCTLEGIGTDTATAIIEYRERTGGFEKIEDLKKVNGIGNAKFNAIKSKIGV